MKSHDQKVFLDGLTVQEKRIREVLTSTYSEIGSEMWGDGAPSKTEFVCVVADRAYDRLTPEDRDYLIGMARGRYERLVLSVR